MARRKKIVGTEEVFEKVEVKKPTPEDTSYKVRKLIENPLKLNMSIVLSDDKPFELSKALLANEMFMMHIDHLIKLEKLERV